jgi:hypothetical protein
LTENAKQINGRKARKKIDLSKMVRKGKFWKCENVSTSEEVIVNHNFVFRNCDENTYTVTPHLQNRANAVRAYVMAIDVLNKNCGQC